MALAPARKRAIWNPNDVAAIVGGRWIPEPVADLQIAGATFKLEDIAAGKLFFTANPQVWGRGFPATGQMLARIRAAGAVGAVVDERELTGTQPPLPVLVVKNTFAALQALAVASRRRYVGQIVAVTGTVGKTSVCRMLTHVLERHAKTASFIGQRNSLPGLRAGMCSIDPDFNFAVVELNMTGKNSVAPKSRLLQPDVAVITTLGLAHLEQHGGSMESVVHAKAGVIDGLRPGGICVLPRDSPWYDELARHAAGRGVARQLSFGEHELADVRLVRGDFGPAGSAMDVDVRGRRVPVRLSAPGRHVAMNCLAMLAIVEALQGDVLRAAADIADWRAPPGRCRTNALKLAEGEALLIDASHNANPESMNAAIDMLGMMPPKDGGRRIAVLADMLELGAISARCHAELASPLLRAGADRIFTLGEQARALRQALPAARLAVHSDNVEQLGLAVESALQPGDVVMIQGSRATGISEVAERLKSLERASELLIDIDARRILRQSAIDAPRFPASLVKLMTLHQVFAALDDRKVGLHDRIRASARATHLHPQSSVLGLAEGDFLSI